MIFLGLEWYWWLVIVIVLTFSIPFKVKFLKWWQKNEQDKKKEKCRNWGDNND